MQYTITINQVGIVKAGLLEKTDMIDWAIIDYLREQYFLENDKMFVKKKNQYYTRVNYKQLIQDLPILHIANKNTISNRFKKLKKLNLIDTVQSVDNSLYFILTPLCIGIYSDKAIKATNN